MATNEIVSAKQEVIAYTVVRTNAVPVSEGSPVTENVVETTYGPYLDQSKALAVKDALDKRDADALNPAEASE